MSQLAKNAVVFALFLLALQGTSHAEALRVSLDINDYARHMLQGSRSGQIHAPLVVRINSSGEVDLIVSGNVGDDLLDGSRLIARVSDPSPFKNAEINALSLASFVRMASEKAGVTTSKSPLTVLVRLQPDSKIGLGSAQATVDDPWGASLISWENASSENDLLLVTLTQTIK